MAKIKALNKAKDFLVDFKEHWDEPYKGRYIPNKEVVAYGIGGMGVYLVTYLVAGIGLSASNLIVGSCIGIQPTHLYFMTVISNIFGILITIVRSYIMDNIKSSMGKFRPFLKWMAVPTMLSALLFVWMPYEIMTYNQKIVVVLVLWLVINMVNPFYTESYNMLIQVMSPDSDERTDVMSISQIIFSLAPTIMNLITPFVAQLTGGLTDMRTYRIIYPIITFAGLFLAIPVYKHTNERIIKPRTKENEVRFFDAIRGIVKNKYFWIINVASWVGFLEMSYGVVLSWTFVYEYPDKQELMGVASTIIGNGALWAMIAAPFLIRKFGKRNLLITCNCINIVLLALLLFTYHSIIMVIVVFYINNFVLVLGNIYNPGINADMRDYQQYISGERIDGMFGVVGLIGTFIGYFTGIVLPYLQERCGLKDDYDVLFDATIRDNIFRTMIIASVVGAVLNVIPYFFYDLTEQKHRAITYVLRIRTMFDDYSADCLDDKTLVETMEIIDNIKASKNAEPVKITNEAVKQAKAMPKSTDEEKQARSSAIKKAKDDMYNQRLMNENIEIAPFVLDELNKFSTRQFEKQIELAHFICDNEQNGLEFILNSINDEVASFGKPQSKDDKLILTDLKAKAREIKYAINTTKKHYIDGVAVEPNESALDDAQALPATTIKQAVERRRAVKKAINDKAHYKNAVKPFTDAKKLIIQKDAYECMDDLVARYNEIKAQEAVTA